MTAPLYPDDEIVRLQGVRRTTGELQRRPAPPAAAGGAYWAYLEMSAGLTVGAGATEVISWDQFRTNIWLPGAPPTGTQGFYTTDIGGSVYSTTGDEHLQLVGYGAWYAHASFNWASGIAAPNARLAITGSFGASTYDTDMIQTYSTVGGDIFQWQNHAGINIEASDGDIPLSGRQFECSVKNGDGSSRTLDAASLVVLFWPLAAEAHDLVYGINYV